MWTSCTSLHNVLFCCLWHCKLLKSKNLNDKMKFKFLVCKKIFVATDRFIPFTSTYIAHCTIQSFWKLCTVQYKVILTLHKSEAACVRIEGWNQERPYRSQGRAGAASGSGQPAAHPFTQGGQAHVWLRIRQETLRWVADTRGVLWRDHSMTERYIYVWIEFLKDMSITLSLTLTETLYYVNIDADCILLLIRTPYILYCAQEH
jgi:hypothetical protein